MSRHRYPIQVQVKVKYENGHTWVQRPNHQERWLDTKYPVYFNEGWHRLPKNDFLWYSIQGDDCYRTSYWVRFFDHNDGTGAFI